MRFALIILCATGAFGVTALLQSVSPLVSLIYLTFVIATLSATLFARDESVKFFAAIVFHAALLPAIIVCVRLLGVAMISYPGTLDQKQAAMSAIFMVLCVAYLVLYALSLVLVLKRWLQVPTRAAS